MYQKNYKKNQISRRKNTSGYYTDGSVAYDNVPHVRESNTPAPRNKRPESKRKTVNTFSWLYTIKVFMLFGVVFVGCMMIMSAHALIVKERMTLQTHRDELAAIKNENAILSADISQQLDLEKIKEKAINDLGMSEPQEYQKVYIEVPKQSYTVQYATQETAEDSTSKGRGILGILNKD